MSLLDYVNAFTVQAPTAPLVAGEPIELRAVPNGILDVSTVEVVSAPVDLSLVFRHVQLPADGQTPWPPPAIALTNATSGLASAPGATNVEAWAATITGMVPVGLRDISGQVQIDFEWQITDLDKEGGQLGDAVITSGNLNLDNVSLVIPPVITELTTTDFTGSLGDLIAAAVSDPVQAARRIGVQLRVRGRIGSIEDTGWVLIPATPLVLPLVALPIPTVAALFRDDNLTGNAALLMVPTNSPFAKSADLLGAVEPLHTMLGAIHSAAAATSWALGIDGLMSAVDALASGLPLIPHVGLLPASAADIGSFDFIAVNHWFDDDIEDKGSSCLLLSANRKISFFEHDGYEGDELILNAFPQPPLRFGGAVLRILNVAVPQTEPAGCVVTSGNPSGSWDNEFSSYKWTLVE
ncbi:MAG TPA: hypothetical protein VMZ11_09380 [Mycobacteriales bacterium]|nr:hypothetical protein [Mycobacteriales bacterium]